MSTQDIANKIKSFLLKKDDESFLKYPNLVYSLIVLLVLLIFVCAMLSSHESKLQLNPQDPSSDNEILFEDNQAVAVSPKEHIQPSIDDSFDENTQNNLDENIIDESPFNNVELNSASDNTQKVNTNNDVNNETKAPESNDVNIDISSNNETVTVVSKEEKYLFCDNFNSKAQAEANKAAIALTTGFMATIVQKNDFYTLKIGPFTTRDDAARFFSKLDSNDLVGECTLQIDN